MKIVDFLRITKNIDLFANLMVYPEQKNLGVSYMDSSYTIWHCKTLKGQDLDGCCEFKKEDAIKKAKEYLNSELVNFNGIIK